MLGALLYLRLTSLKNLLLSRLRRLKQPKYLVGAIVGAAYFYFVFFRRFGRALARPHPMPRGLALPALPSFDVLPLIATGGALLLLIIATFTWALPTARPGLAFTEAEVAFLFPAPISRRRLIHFKLLGAQVSILISALFFTLVSSGWSFLGGGALIHTLGWWIILTAVNLHLTGATLTVTRLIDGGVSTARRRTVVLGIIGLASAATVFSSWSNTPFFVPGEPEGRGPFAGLTDLCGYLARLLDAGLFHWLLLPGKWVMAPFLSVNGTAFLHALWPAALILVAHYFWVSRMEVSFEEASVATSEKRAARIARIRGGGAFSAAKPKARREPFRLPALGRPELAFLWKNLLSTYPLFHWRTWLVCAAIILVGVPWIVRHEELKGVAIGICIISAVVAAYTLLLGPQFSRQDLRSDLGNSDIIKTYPLAGWQVVLGELLTPTAILAGMLWLTLLAAGCALEPGVVQLSWFTQGVRVFAGLGLALVIPPLCLLQLLVPNAAALVFPAWFHATRQRTGGIDVMGQRIIFVFGQFLVIVLALAPAVVGAGLIIFATQWLVGLSAAVVFATLLALAVLIGEIWCGLWWLGGRFEKLDLATELRP